MFTSHKKIWKKACELDLLVLNSLHGTGPVMNLYALFVLQVLRWWRLTSGHAGWQLQGTCARSLPFVVCSASSPTLHSGAWDPATSFAATNKQGITNTLALPIEKMLYIYVLCPHSEHQQIPFQSKHSKHFHQKNRFTSCQTGSNNVELPKVGSNAIVTVPVGAGPTKRVSSHKKNENDF
jgi:hypothetical protein